MLLLWTLLGCAPAEPPTSDQPWAAFASAPHLVAEGDGLRLTWFEPEGEGHLLRTSRSRGERWEPAITIAASERFFVNWADTPSVTRGGDGSWLAHFAERTAPKGYAYDVVLARSTDGARWERIGPIHDDGTQTEHGFVSSWPTADGVGFVWLDGRQTADEGPMSVRTGEVGVAIGPSKVVDERVCDCCGTAATLAPDGVPVVAWRDRSDAEVRDVRVGRLDGSPSTMLGGDGWQVGGCPVNGPALVTAGDRIFAAWTTGATGSLEVRVAASTDGGRAFGPARVLAGGTPAPLGRVGAAVVGDRVVVSWLQGLDEAEAAEVRARAIELEADAVVAGPVVSLGKASSSRNAGFPRLAADGDQLVAVWSDADGLVLARHGASVLAGPMGPLESPGRSRTSASGPETVPTLAGTDLEGKAWSLEQTGRPLAVALWASWCGPCRAELPLLAELTREDGLDLVAVAVDDRPEAARKLRDELAPGLHVVLAASADVREAFGTGTVPNSWLFDASGKRVWSHPAALDRRALDEALEAL